MSERVFSSSLPFFFVCFLLQRDDKSDITMNVACLCCLKNYTYIVLFPMIIVIRLFVCLFCFFLIISISPFSRVKASWFVFFLFVCLFLFVLFVSSFTFSPPELRDRKLHWCFLSLILLFSFFSSLCTFSLSFHPPKTLVFILLLPPFEKKKKKEKMIWRKEKREKKNKNNGKKYFSYSLRFICSMIR